jgi:hypothetical protein
MQTFAIQLGLDARIICNNRKFFFLVSLLIFSIIP